MKKYHYHPDRYIIIINEDKSYIETEKLAKFDLQTAIITPIAGSTEFEYIQDYGTRNFNKGDMISFSDLDRPDLNDIISNIDNHILRKKIRESIDNNLWEIPEDMKTYSPPEPEPQPEPQPKPQPEPQPE